MNRRTVTVSILILLFSIVFFYIATLFRPGSYVYSECYTFDVNEAALVEAVMKFKRDSVHYVVPNVSFPKESQITRQEKMIDGRRDSTDHFFHVYFYYQNEDQIVNTWIVPDTDDSSKSIFAFNAINTGTILGNWKDINKDYTSAENERQKKMFEQRILNSVKKYLKPQ